MGSLPWEYVTPKGVTNLKKFKYKSGVYTPLDNVMNYWWIFCANFIPWWISPNMVTLLGFCTAVVTNVNFVYKDMTTGIEPFDAFLVAIGLFTYQTLDAIDGKHARATGQSSVLGSLFDHGCDGMMMPV